MTRSLVLALVAGCRNHNNSHTMLAVPATTTSTNVVLRPWVETWARGDAAFTTVGP